MENLNYRTVIKSLGPHKALGQNFLISRDIAEMEAEYAKGLNALELGPGLGILTKELCESAKKVIAIEKDERLFNIISDEIQSKKLKLINNDFFLVDQSVFSGIDIMVSNIPYNLSSKVIYWLGKMNMPALICIQKEFAQHMLGKPGTRDYSKLSVISALSFKSHHVKDVSAGNFYPVPKVDSCLIYLAPKSNVLDDKIISTISLIMNHKKKRLKNAIVDSSSGFGIEKDAARRVAGALEESEQRPFQLEPETILKIALEVNAAIPQKE
jgi:16S rRNA (adenine1518-N6/adenine1519-N6)-dimethyltransferase